VERSQADGPGAAAVRNQVRTLKEIVEAVATRAADLRARLDAADRALDEAVDGWIGR